VQPVSVPYKGYRLWELPPNGQGIAALEMLRILETYDLQSMGHNSPAYLHHLIEAKKLAYADIEFYVGDPASMKHQPEQFLSDEYVRGRRALLDSQKAMERTEPGSALTASDTVYLAAADAHGNMVSLINSVFDQFGSGIVVPGTGLLLQDRGISFTMTENRPNTVGPRKRPFHTIIPGFVTKTAKHSGVLRDAAGEEPYVALGVMGGPMQPQGHVQVLLNMLLFGFDPQQATDAARFRHLSGKQVVVESQIGAETQAGLRALGHDVSTAGFGAFGGSQIVQKLAKGWAAGSDPRKDGAAVGY
jgi:gamma-glutamyltranspeptidase/glutathione hydrolase